MPPYRPQFAFSTPAGWEDQDFDHYFDSGNTQALGNTPALNIPPGNNPVNSIPLNIDPDAPFLWRGIKFPMAAGLRDVSIRLRDPFGNYMQDDLTPAYLFAVPPASGGLDGGQSCIFESEIECPPGSTVLLDVLYDAPQSAQAFAPVAIAGPTGLGLGSYSGARNAAIPWKGALWEFVTAPGIIGAYSSLDNGQSWNLIDGANSIPSVTETGATFWDGVSNTVTILYAPTANGAIRMRSFDLDAQTWGVDFGATSAPTLTPEALFLRLNGSYIGLFVDTANSPFPTYISIFAAGSWSAPLDVTTGATALPGWGAGGGVFRTTPTSVLDSTDTLHVMFMSAQNPVGVPNWNNRYFYQQVLSGGTLGNFQELFAAGQQLAIQDIHDAGNGPTSRLQIVGTQLVFGVIRNTPTGAAPVSFPAVIVGSPLTVPVFVESASIDPGDVATTTQPGEFPNIFYDPITSQLYAVWSRNSRGLGDIQIQFAFTRAAGFLTGWQSHVIFDAGTSALGGGSLGYPLVLIGAGGVIGGMSFDIVTASPG